MWVTTLSLVRRAHAVNNTIECDNLSIKISQHLFSSDLHWPHKVASVKIEWRKSVVATENFTPISTGYVSAALHLRHAGGADMFHFSLCVNPHQSSSLRICSAPAPAVRSPLEQIRRTSISGGCRSTTQQFSWIQHGAEGKSNAEITKNIRLLFKIKHSVLTPAHKSQKRDKHKHFCWSFGQEHFVLLFLITQTYNCEWLSDYILAWWYQLSNVLRHGLKPQPVGIAVQRAVDLYPVEIGGYSPCLYYCCHRKQHISKC